MHIIAENVVREVNDQGEMILEDGSKWLIDPHQVADASNWVPSARVRVELVDEDASYPYELTEIVHDVSVRAMRLETDDPSQGIGRAPVK
ncbi:MAG: hypothetical protein ACOC0U_02015 [Desulfovibrionales bacterium]